MRRTIGWWLSAVGLLWASVALAQTINQPSAEGIRIDGEVVQLDERCTVNMANRTARVNADGSFAIPNVPFEQGIRSRVRAVCTRDGRLLLGSSPLLDLAVDPAQIPIFFDQYVPLPARIRVYADEDQTVLREPDELRRMIAIAEMPNGQQVDITNVTAGTVWTSSDTRIATVTPQGVVTPLERGDVIIRAQNEGLSGSLRLQVRIPNDRDGDGLPDDFELAHGLDPDDPTDALLDGDLDGLDNVQEFAAATAPGIADSDGDGLLDGDEVNRGTDPRDADSDGDGLLDGEEVRIGTDPDNFDSDGDGIGDGAEIDFDLDPLSPDQTTTMAGQVIDPDGAAVEGAVVLVEDRFQGFTDAAGAFEIPGVVVNGGPLLARVRLLRDGVVLDGKSRRVEPVPGGITDAGTIRLRTARGAVGGTILSPRGEPVPGARVVVTVGEDERGINANAAGQYLFQRFDEGPVTVIATDPRTGLRGRAFGDLAEDDSVQIDVRLSASGTIQGSVFGRDGAPVGPAISVRLRGPVNLDSTTDDFSRFRFDFIPLGVYSVEAFDANGNRGRTTATITGTNQVVPADVSFLGKGRVAGIVETGGGALVAGARVTLRSQSPFGGSAEVISDNAGGFDIPDIFVGPFQLTAVDPVTGLAGVAEGNVDFEGDVARVTVTLRGAGRIVGAVLESDAETPVAGASVTVSPGGRTVVADDQGIFRFDGLPLGRYTLTAEHPDNPDRGRRVVNLIEPDAEVQADVTLLGLGTVRVTVLDAGGETAQGARVTLDGRGEFDQRFEAIADADGRVEFDEVLAGPFALSAVEPLSGLAGALESNVLADEEVELELRLESAGSITGLVLRPDGVTPVRGIRVRLTPSGRESTTDAVGRFRFDLVPVANGPFTLEAFDGTGARRGQETDIALAEHAEVVQRNIVVIGTGTVRGSVLRADGTPASAAAVTLDSAVPGAPRRFANTEADGSYLIDGVPEGRFTVNASLREERQAGAGAGEIQADGEVVTLDIQMDENFIPPPPPAGDGGPPSNSNPLLTRVYDANNFDYAIHQDGSIRNGSRNVFRGDGGLNAGGFLLYMRAADDPQGYEAFAGQGGRIELDGRQLSLPGAGPDGLQVTRRVYVPGDGYFVRFVEVLRNPTADPIEVDVQVRTHFQFTTRTENGFRFTDPPQLNLSSSGDAFITVGPDAGADADRWVVIDDRVDADPFISGNQPTAAAVFAGVGGAVGPSDGLFLLDDAATYGQLAVTYGRVTIQPGQTVSLMHFGVQQLTGLGARAAAERLEQPAPETLVGLTEEDRATIANFDLAGADFVDPLPPLDSSVSGAVLEGDGETRVPRSRVTWKSRHPIFGRTFQFTGGDDAIYRINARLGGNGNNVPVPAADFDVFARHPVTAIDSPVFPGAFPEGTATAEQDIAFNNTGLVVGVVRRPDGNVVSTGSVRMTGGDLANAANANIAIDGRFVFTGVPPGNYRLVATVPIPGGTPLTGEGFVNVVAGEVAEAELEIIPTGGVIGQVLTGGGQPAIEVQTRILGDGTDRRGRSDTGGAYTFFDMPLGDFEVRAQEPNTGIWSAEDVTVEAFEVTEQDIQLIPLGEIQMLVRYSDGRPVADAAVQIRRDALGNFFAGAGRTDALGRRTLRFVPLGGFDVRVISPQNGLIVVETEGAIAEHDEVVVLEIEIPVDQPPQVLLTAPADGAEFVEGAQVLLTAEANDDLGVRRVDFLVGGAVIGSDSNAPYVLNYRLPAGDGRAEIPVVAVAYDNGPNQTPSEEITIVRLDDEQPPTVEVTAPFVGVRVIEGTRVGVSALANDDVAVQQVEFFAGDVSIGVDDTPPYAIAWDVPPDAAPLDEVQMTLRAVATDRAGNSAEATRDVPIVPDAEPTIRLVQAPEEGGTVVEGTTVRFEAVAQDDLGVAVDLVVGGEVLQTRNQPPFRFDWVAPAADAVENPFSVTLRARDTIGQTADAVSTFDVTIDLPPTVEIIAPVEGAEAVEGSTVQVTATAEDDLGVDEVRFYVDGELQATRLVPPYSVAVQMSPGDADGAISIRVEAIDNAGQSGDAIREVSRLDDEVPPTGAITTPAPDALVSVGASDVILVIDRESSMSLSSNIDFEADGDVENRLEGAVLVARTLLGFFDPETTRVAVLPFANTAVIRQSLTDDFAAVDAALDTVRDGGFAGGLRFDSALAAARTELIGDNAQRGATPVVYFISDGTDGYPQAQVDQFIAEGAVINAIRIGPDGNDFALRQMPEDTGGSFTVVDEAADLAELGGSVLFGSDALVVGVDAQDDVAVRRVTVGVDSGDGAVVDEEIDARAPYNAVFGLPALDEQIEVTITAAIEDFGGNITDADPVTVTVLPADTAPLVETLTTTRPDGASVVDFYAGLGIEVPATYGSPGDTVALTGRFFDPIEARNDARFDGVLAGVPAASKIALQIVIPEGAASGELTLVSGGEPALPIAFRIDTDRDGLDDEEEIEAGTDPENPDTDDDGLLDGVEVKVIGTDPRVQDTDGDGLPDGFEVDNGLEPVATDDGRLDPDGDGLKNFVEFALGTEANNPDTDGDGLLDGEEFDLYGSDPLVVDTDGAGATDGQEVLIDGTDPTDPADDVRRVSPTFELRDGDNFRWEVANQGHIPNGTNDAYDNGLFLQVGGNSFPAQGQMRLLEADRTLRLGPSTVSQLTVERDIYVPPDARFARYLEILRNDTDAPISTTVRIYGQFGSDGSTNLIGESSGDGVFGPEDDWFSTDDSSDGGGDSSMAHVLSGFRARLEPTTARLFSSDDWDYTFDVEVPPGETVIIMHFATQNPNRADALANAQAIVDLPAVTLAAMTPAEQAQVLNFFAYVDSDKDGLPDDVEADLGTDPGLVDTDGDGLDDLFEVENGLDPLVGGEQDLDLDDDGLTNAEENAAGTDPTNPDTDGDGLPDGVELNELGTDPTLVDTDGDGLLDGFEVDQSGTDPTLADTDGDGLDDRAELEDLPTDPLVADTDGDGMLDGFELDFGFDPLDPADGALDLDNDGLTNAGESAAGSNPFDRDSDGDDLLDGEEVDAGLDPTVIDTDGGGRSDYDELLWDLTDGTDPADDLPTTGFVYELRDGGDFRWDIDGVARIGNGSANPYDTGHRLSVDNFSFPGFNQGVLLQDGREVMVGPYLRDGERDGLLVWRRVYVPEGEIFARHMEIFENRSDAERQVDVRMYYNIGSPLQVAETSSGDAALDAQDDWIINQNSPGNAAVLHWWSDGLGAAQPSAASFNSDDLEWTTPITIPPGERVIVMHYSIQTANALDATAAFAAIERFGGSTLAGLTPEDQAAVVNLRAYPDTDGDGIDDQTEALIGTDPGNPDTDGDGLLDGFERTYGFDPLVAGEQDLDPDGDTLTNLAEQAFGSSPLSADGDEDGLDDLAEQAAGSDPLDPDSDGDLLLDGYEVLTSGTNPAAPDSDGGGRNDFEELVVDGTDALLVGDDAPDQNVNLTLNDALGFRWDLRSTGGPSDGTSDAYDGGHEASIDGAGFSAVNAALLPGGREIVWGPVSFGNGIRVYRRALVPAPELEGEAYARFVDILVNPTAADIDTNLRIYTNLGSDGNSNLIGSSLDDGQFTVEDGWVVSDDNDNSNDPVVLHLFADDEAIVPPSAVDGVDGFVQFEWDITVPAGGIATAVHFGAQRTTRAEMLDFAADFLDIRQRVTDGLTRDVILSVFNLDAAPDDDNDGLDNDEEALAGTDPGDPDSDDDGLPDGYEVETGLDPLDPADALIDADGDGLTTAQEYAAGTPPDDADIDRDNLNDAGELQAGTDPYDPDSDDDDLFDGDEVGLYGTNPLAEDTDAGGTFDAIEVYIDRTDPLAPGDDIEPPCNGDVYGNVCLTHLSASCQNGSARQYCADRGEQLITYAEFQEIVANGWVRPTTSYHTLAVDQFEELCPAEGVGNTRIPGFGDFGLWNCGDNHNYCSRAIACTNGGGIGARETCSEPSIERATVVFENAYPDRTLSVSFYDYLCAEQEVAVLGPGEEISVDTFVDHQWRVRDAGDNELIDTVTIRSDGRRYTYPITIRPVVAECGNPGMELDVLLEPDDPFDPLAFQSSCAPDEETQALFVSRQGNIDALGWRAYLEAGGIIVTEYGNSDDIYAAVTGTPVAQGNNNGGCSDRVDPAVRFNEADPFWLANGDVPLNPGDTGCGFDVGDFPGITPLGGWDGNNVSLAYIDVGNGRLWLVDTDWQDGQLDEGGADAAPSIQLLRYMMLNRR